MDYDVAIIGGGPGGYVAAIRAAQLGHKVAIIEENHLGGICLNWGCIPTKSLLKNANVYNLIKNASKYGIEISSYKINWSKIIQRSRNIANRLNKGIEYLLKKNNLINKKVKRFEKSLMRRDFSFPLFCYIITSLAYFLFKGLHDSN